MNYEEMQYLQTFRTEGGCILNLEDRVLCIELDVAINLSLSVAILEIT